MHFTGHWDRSVSTGSTSSQVDRALDLRSKGLRFDSQCWPCLDVLGKLCIPHCLCPTSRNGYLVLRYKVGLIVVGYIGAHWWESLLNMRHGIWTLNNYHYIYLKGTKGESLYTDTGYHHTPQTTQAIYDCGEKSLMAKWLEQVSQWHEMYCLDLEVMSSNPDRVELWVRSTSVLSRTWSKFLFQWRCCCRITLWWGSLYNIRESYIYNLCFQARHRDWMALWWGRWGGASLNTDRCHHPYTTFSTGYRWIHWSIKICR